jgi:hypothetical protein
LLRRRVVRVELQLAHGPVLGELEPLNLPLRFTSTRFALLGVDL